MTFDLRLACLRGAALGALALNCAHPVAAQEAQPSPPPALPGVADIDFSLKGRQVENPGTPTEGRSLQPSPTSGRSETASPRQAPSPEATATRSTPPEAPRERATQARPPAQAPDTVTPTPANIDADTGPSQEQAAQPAFESAEAPAAAPSSEGSVPDRSDDASSGFPAWPFGLALLAAAVWFFFRRRKRQGVVPAEPITPVPEPEVANAPAVSPPPSLPPIAPEPVQARPVAPAPDVAPETISSPAPANAAAPVSSKGLTVKVADLARRAAPPPEPPQPPQPAIARYDAFGRPIAAAPRAAPPPPAPPPKPKTRIVRYDALGMPIRD